MRTDSPFDARIARRGLLGRGGAAAALELLAQIRAVPARAVEATRGAERFFSPEETEILTQVVERMVATGEPSAPQPRDTQAVATIDALCLVLEPAVSGVLPRVLRAVEYGPFLFERRFTRFTRMSDPRKDASLAGWMTSRFGLRRQAFLALRNLSLLGYYSQEETWPLVGDSSPLLRPVRFR